MLRQVQKELLSRTGPGTPMDQMFRASWQLAAEELPANECPPVRVKLLGERLLAWRDTNGKLALTDEFCAHPFALSPNSQELITIPRVCRQRVRSSARC
jgi:phthalate 4,5-dioxygenase